MYSQGARGVLTPDCRRTRLGGHVDGRRVFHLMRLVADCGREIERLQVLVGHGSCRSGGLGH